jgi:hypothetical protein
MRSYVPNGFSACGSRSTLRVGVDVGAAYLYAWIIFYLFVGIERGGGKTRRQGKRVLAPAREAGVSWVLWTTSRL